MPKVSSRFPRHAFLVQKYGKDAVTVTAKQFVGIVVGGGKWWRQSLPAHKGDELIEDAESLPRGLFQWTGEVLNRIRDFVKK